MAITYADNNEVRPNVMIKVIGVGGGGGNAVKNMMDTIIPGVELISANTDMQVLSSSPIQNKVQLGVKTTQGMGAGSQPEIGRRAAEEDSERIREALAGADIVFIAAGMGGGTGTGAAPVVASIAREMDILTIAIVTKPFDFEGGQRITNADEGIEELKKVVNCLIVIPNDRLKQAMGGGSLMNAFEKADDVLKDAVLNLSTLIQREGLINIDLNDIKTVMSERGLALIGVGEAKGEQGATRAREAVEKAVSSPLLENIDLNGTKGLIACVLGANIDMDEFAEIGNILNNMVDAYHVKTKIGAIHDPEMQDGIRVMVFATGIGSDEAVQPTGLFAGSAPEATAPAKGEETLGGGNFKLPPILRRNVK